MVREVASVREVYGLGSVRNRGNNTLGTLFQMGLRIMSEHKYVVFKLAKEYYGIPIERVERILPSQNVTRIPKTPKSLMGIFDLRGDTIPAVDLRQRFELPNAELEGNFVVCLTDVGRCAFKVDGVDGIAVLHEENIEAAPQKLTHQEPGLVAGVAQADGKLVLLIEPDIALPKELGAYVSKTQASA